jgi:glycosyltransferase involved in cell wall biosynthesis
MKKIVVINLTGGPILKNGGFYFTEGGLVHALFSLENLTSNYDITILCPNYAGNKHRLETKYRGVKVVCLGEGRWVRWMHSGDLSFLREVWRYVRKDKPDILIGNGVSAACFLRFVPARACKVGVIHHLYHTATVNGSSRRAFSGMAALEKWALGITRLDKVAVINPRVKETLVKEEFCSGKIVVVGNGVDVGSYRFSENKEPFSLVYVGRLTELKRVSSLLEVVSRVRKKIPDVMLHIVGDGPRHEQVRLKIAELDLSRNVVMYGYLMEEEKMAVLEKSAIYLSNSMFEGFGIPLVEAMAAGAVPIVSNIYSHRFIFQGEDVGYLIDDEEEMEKQIVALLGNEAERSRLARNGRGLVERRWTWTRVGERYKELFEE